MFGYEFVTLNDDQKHERRTLLEFYPFIGFLSTLVILACFQLGYFVTWLTRQGLEYERPKSPSFNRRSPDKWTWLKTSSQNVERIRWWLRKPVIRGWGTRAEWIGGTGWTLWLLCLSAAQTGNDYLHLTKRFGIIGASQLPIHYLLAMRSPYSPIQYITCMSHEQLKSPHQILGRIIYLLFALHALFYTNFFVLSGLLAKRILDKDVILGLASITLFTVLSTTALGFVRRWSYRLFYISHITIANTVIITLFFHVSHIRPYLWGVIIINGAHLVFRSFSLRKYSGTITLLPGTNLVQVRIPLPPGDPALKWKYGQHVYLSRPTGKPYTNSIHDQYVLRTHTNPFSIASLPSIDHELLLVSRTLNGTTRKTSDLAKSLSSTPIPLAIEGPYGHARHLPDLSTFDSILLVAGGVGATYTMPLYRSLLAAPPTGPSTPDVHFIWSVRKLAETYWVFPADHAEEAVAASEDAPVQVFVTQPAGPDLRAGDGGAGEEIELTEDQHLLSLEEQMERPRKGMVLKAGRPNVAAIVDEVLSKGDRVAVFVCGPTGLAETVSGCVERWVERGSEVYWHDEAFGW